MRTLNNFFLLVCSLFVCFRPAWGDEAGPELRTGLVLAGGGALGFAHVGVLKVLEEHQIPVHLVTGTSMGAIVGAAYAAGVPLPELQSYLEKTDWDELFSEVPPRREVPLRYKAGRNRELYGDVKLGMTDSGSLALPAGVIQGQNVLPVLQQIYGKVQSPVDFDNLALPFRAVAADIETGRAFVPARGDLATIVRASMSVPAFFSPVEFEGRLLVDGGIANNLPVDIALQMGADRLIVIELYADLKKRDELQSPLSISGQILSMLLAQNSSIQRGLMRPQDVLIEPDLKGFSSTDFNKASEIFKRGEDAARMVIDRLKGFSVPLDQYATYQSRRCAPRLERHPIKAVRIDNDSTIPDEVLLETLAVKAGDTLDRDKMDKGVGSIYNMGQFSEVRYDVKDTAEGPEVEVSARRKPWYHKYLRIGASLEDNFSGDSVYRLGGVLRTTSFSEYGGFLDLEGQIGFSPKLALELYQPFSKASPFFFAPYASYGRNPLYAGRNGEIEARYQRRVGLGGVRLGREIGILGETFLGINRGIGKLDRDIGDASLRDLDYDIADASFGFTLDALDTPDFPTRGYLVDISSATSVTGLGATDSFSQLQGRVNAPVTFGANTYFVSIDSAVTFDERPVERSYSIGGFLDLAGYSEASLVASDYTIGRLGFYRKFSETKSPLLGFSFFAGAALDVASIRSDIPQLPDEPLVIGGLAFIGVDTPLLPTYLGVGYNNNQETAVYLAIGRLSSKRR